MHKHVSVIIGAMLIAGTASANFGSADPINRGPVNVFRRDSLHCKGGWTFPGLVWGDRPISACMYRNNKKNVFGGEF